MRLIRQFFVVSKTGDPNLERCVTALPEDIASGREKSASEGLRYFAGIPLAGKRYLETSIGIGERARSAVAAGALGAECIVAQHPLVQLIGLINLYYQYQTIVVYPREAPLSDAKRSVNVASVRLSRTSGNSDFDDIAARVTDLLLLESDASSRGWFDGCIGRTAGFPKWLIYKVLCAGLVEPRMALSRTGSDLSDLMVGQSLAREPNDAAVVTLDLERSARVTSLCGQKHATRLAFTRMRDIMANEVVKNAKTIGFRLAELVESLAGVERAAGKDGFGTDLYWLMYFTGAREYITSGVVSRSNTYADYLLKLVESKLYDAGLRASLENWEFARERLIRRFEDVVGILRTGVTKTPLLVMNPFAIEALEALGLSTERRGNVEFVQALDGSRYWTPLIDGHHRAVSLFLSGAKSTEAVFAWTNIHEANLTVAGSGPSDRPVGWEDSRLGRALEDTIASLARPGDNRRQETGTAIASRSA